ncbi:two-component system sensor histidine kinase MtrB [Streptomyces sp. SAI-135]|uniref:ATP-binding protein n=1 Tax=unclassified Streptomyces TaxID=2593676 RepID=UPI00247392D3|nr:MULTISPECIES: ATP-binding protein [unclassified Streptomyces]MDH6520810.1 two-component system sensor histidine kinase MtrB [Streptomyces sp. SAI-090]MDH6553029.1 two-component system sensor histidine kinase MtrB [Streptomyces sp. SAI-041]MDH6572113.1 two-component system sensor histidine kinase MtrB [Streptomyces sp. SAI-117]MDH6582927.1 two-component system sensor histidine kinase MtrB [Streptomyces sp. SAI-133]MDH6615098.1 two-component system sensor histidine kinase MtrB [Streptomyces s
MRKRRLRGLRARLVVAFGLVAAVAAVTTGALTFREARTGVLQQSQDATIRQLRAQLNQHAAELAVPPDESALREFAHDVAATESQGSWRVLVTYGDRSGSSAPGDPFAEVTPALRDAVGSSRATVFQRVRGEGRTSLVVGMSILFGGRDTVATTTGIRVFLVVPQTTEQAYVDALVTAAERAMVAALALAVVLALLAARGVLVPVRKLRLATRQIAEGRLDTRLAVNGSDELADLSHTFNETAAALEASVAELREMESRARRFAADVSHELRTPLAAMSAVTDVLDEDAARLDPDTATAVRLISAETVKLARLVDDLMEISRFDAGAAVLHLDEIDLAESIRRTLASRGWTDTVATELPPPDAVRARVDPRRLDVVVANLVGNALKHGARPVRVRLGAADAVAVIEVRDSGPGIRSDVLPHVFERFYKSDTARIRSEGSGLGLAITAENVRVHGGTVRAANHPAGGAVFTVELPLRRDESPEENPS